MASLTNKPYSDSFSRLADEIPEIIIRYDLECRRVYVNRAYERATGHQAADVIGTTLDTGWVADTPMNEYLANLKHVLRTGETRQFPLQITTRAGAQIHQQVTIQAERDEAGGIVGALGISYDITDLVEAQNTLRDSEAKYRQLINSANDGISIQELDTNNIPGPFIEVNDELCRRLGYSREELLRMGPPEITHPDHRGNLEQTLPQLLQQGSLIIESVQYTRDRRSIPVEVSISLLDQHDKRLLFAVARDTSERKRSEREILQINRYLRTLSHCNEALIHATDETQLLQDMCRIAVERGQFTLACIAYLEDEQTIRTMAHHGPIAESFLGGERQLDMRHYSDPGHPVIRAISTGEVQVIHTIQQYDSTLWKEHALAHGFRSAIVLPLRADKTIIGSFNIYLDETGSFGSQEVALLMELADDLSYGIQALRTRAEHEHFMTRLQASMTSTIQALSSTVELRDPYTAGHQRRVANLAVTVARQMGYDEERSEIIYLAGIVHDIGKIAVPSEILSRPGRLTENELKLAQTHAEAGYEVLRGVDFPWPIADIVRQHHERLDGSGYPQGLKGSTILPEARILAVCDVVEAMTTHRPYRPGLGIDIALAEIERGKGTLYDPTAVDACIQVIQNGFSFDG